MLWCLIVLGLWIAPAILVGTALLVAMLRGKPAEPRAASDAPGAAPRKARMTGTA